MWMTLVLLKLEYKVQMIHNIYVKGISSYFVYFPYDSLENVCISFLEAYFNYLESLRYSKYT